jgi:hypothetical protein
MNKKLGLYFSLAIIILFIVFMIYDIAKNSGNAENQTVVAKQETAPEAAWEIAHSLEIPFGDLKGVSTSPDGIFVGGDSYIALYSFDYNLIWKIDSDQPVTALSVYGDTVYATTQETLLVLSSKGLLLDEWGPYEDNSILTSVSANNGFVGIADAGNSVIFILNLAGAVHSIIGQPGDEYVLPSAYFDLHLNENMTLITANPGKRSIEFRNFNGEITSRFGEAGTGLEWFCGCCNPSHFALLPGGNIVTAEKGINRIKIVDQTGNLIELVDQPAHFMASVPVDLAVAEKLIFAANPSDSKLYTFKRR